MVRDGGCPHTFQCFRMQPGGFCGYGWKILLCCTARSCCSSLCRLPMQSHSNHCVKSCAETHAWKGWEAGQDSVGFCELLSPHQQLLTGRVFVAMSVCQTLSITKHFALRAGQSQLNICWKSIPGIFLGKLARC